MQWARTRSWGRTCRSRSVPRGPRTNERAARSAFVSLGTERRTSADRASAYGLEPLIVDGNDVEEVYGVASVYIERARQGGGPALIEAKTYRKGGHSRADPAKYRPQKEVEEWLARDALELFRARLTSSGVDEGVLEEIESDVIAMVDRATDEAKSAPPPPASILETNVWADGGSAWRN